MNGLNMTILYHNNPQLDQSCDIYVGEVLCTSKTVQVPAIPASGITVSTLGQSAPPSTVIPNITPSLTPIAATPAYSPTPTVEHTSTTLSAPKPSDNGDNPDDENLPFCDEL